MLLATHLKGQSAIPSLWHNIVPFQTSPSDAIPLLFTAIWVARIQPAAATSKPQPFFSMPLTAGEGWRSNHGMSPMSHSYFQLLHATGTTLYLQTLREWELGMLSSWTVEKCQSLLKAEFCISYMIFFCMKISLYQIVFTISSIENSTKFCKISRVSEYGTKRPLPGNLAVYHQHTHVFYWQEKSALPLGRSII